MSDPVHNTDALLIGTCEFSFSEGAVSAADAQARGWLDFGNLVAFTPEPDLSKEEHLGSYRGVRRGDKTIITQNKLRYKLRADEQNRFILKLLYSGANTTGHTQTALSAVVGQTLGFTATPAKIGYWYDLKKADGTRLREITTATIPAKVEGTDFVLDLKLARIRFLTAQAADLVPTITAPAITAGSALAYIGIKPLQDPVKEGYGKLVVFDQNDINKIVFEHEAFQCEVTIDSGAEVDGTSWTENTLDVLVGADLGTILLRQGNENAGVV